MGDRAPIYDEDMPETPYRNGTTTSTGQTVSGKPYVYSPSRPWDKCTNGVVNYKFGLILIACFIGLVLYIDLKATQNKLRGQISGSGVGQQIRDLKSSLRKSCNHILYDSKSYDVLPSPDKGTKGKTRSWTILQPFPSRGTLSVCGHRVPVKGADGKVEPFSDIRIELLNKEGKEVLDTKIDDTTGFILSVVPEISKGHRSEIGEQFQIDKKNGYCVKFLPSRQNEIIIWMAKHQEKEGEMVMPDSVGKRPEDIAKVRVSNNFQIHNVTHQFCALDDF